LNPALAGRFSISCKLADFCLQVKQQAMPDGYISFSAEARFGWLDGCAVPDLESNVKLTRQPLAFGCPGRKHTIPIIFQAISDAMEVEDNTFTAADEHWMRRALELADRAADAGEVPVGAVLVQNGDCVGEGWNQVISAADPTAHAEVVALRAAAAAASNYRLPNSTLYVTLEPCTMCVGALLHARVDRLIFGASEPRSGVVCSQLQLLEETFYNHRVSWRSGLLAEASSQRLREFFRQRR
jgi:tRNA(adenine34) deaminase